MAFFDATRRSSPPTTPIKSRDFASHPSTTPAGPPPSSAGSFTPQGPPPSSVLGSSYLGHGSHRRSKLSFSESAFDQPDHSEAPEPDFAFSTTSSQFPLSDIQDSPNQPFDASHRSDHPFRDSVQSKNASSPKFGGKPDVFMREAQQGAERTETGVKTPPFPLNSPGGYKGSGSPYPAAMLPPSRRPFQTLNSPQGSPRSPYPESLLPSSRPQVQNLNSPQGNPGSPYPESMLPSSRRPAQKPLIYSNPGNAKRAKLDESWVQPFSPEKAQATPKKKSSAFSAIAGDLAARADAAPLDEPDAFILDTDDIVGRMYDQVRNSNFDPDNFALNLSEISDKLLELWRKYSTRLTSAENLSVSGGIGPGDSAPDVTKACFVSSLILPLHHAPLVQQTPSNGMSSSGGRRAPFRTLVQPDQSGTKASIPKVLFDWINFYHSPQIGRIDALRATQPNPTSSAAFWDIILGAVLRANFSQVVQLLEAADFNYARSAMEDGYEQPGYHGAQLQNIQRCINKAIQLLRSSPGIERDDWDVKGLEWAMYRKRITSAITELEDLAEGGEPAPVQEPEPFDAPHFGISSMRSSGFSFSQSARMADSQVPWTIYQSLKTMYNILIGDVPSILNISQDWVEATVGLVAWWDGDDDNDITLKQSSRRAPAKRSLSQAPRSVDSNPEEAYLRRLDYTFGCVTDKLGNEGFRVNSMNHIEVGLASIFEGNVEGVFQLLRRWSLPVASAAAEVASFGGWLETAAGAEPLPGFNESDLMVLNYGQRDKRIRKDDLLMDYASAVFDKPRLHGTSEVRDGWELSLELLSRLDDQEVMKTQVNEYLDRVGLDTADRMDKMVLLCTDLGFTDEARKVSERYGDKVAETSGDYGTSLICYARAHCAQKIENIIDLLISFSLIESRAYPPTSDLDEQLRKLLYEPQTSLAAVASVDGEGAAMLQFYFSGYAALRSYYETRDEEAVHLESGQDRKKRRPLARKRAAAESLVAVVGSAADSIYGGLFDPDRKTAVQVDGLLVLLGEVLALADPDPNRFFTTDQQITILAAIEDLETVTPRVYDQCEECFQSALFHYRRLGKQYDTSGSGTNAGGPTSPRKLLKKSVSSMTANSGFSLIGSEMLDSQGGGSGDSIGDSGVLVPRPEGDKEGEIKRGWDWRTKIARGSKGEDILRDLRLRLAKGLSLGGGAYRVS